MEWKRPKNYKKIRTIYLCPYCEEDTWVDIRDDEIHSWVEHRRLMTVADVAKTYRLMYNDILPVKKVDL